MNKKIRIGSPRPEKKKEVLKGSEISKNYEQNLDDHFFDALRYSMNNQTLKAHKCDGLHHRTIDLSGDLESQIDDAIDAQPNKVRLIVVPEGLITKLFTQLNRSVQYGAMFYTQSDIDQSNSMIDIKYLGIKVVETQNIKKNEIILI